VFDSLTQEQIAVFNYLDTITAPPYDNWDYFNIYPAVYYLLHYQLAFMSYSLAQLFETTPGYRTDYYSDVSENVIQRMNTSYADYGLKSIENFLWLQLDSSHGYENWTDYYYPDPISPDADDVYTGGYRGPANIMWTAHFALMELLHQRGFQNDEYIDEYNWYMDDWINSLTTDGLGNPQNSGIWENGLIPCQPYGVWVQCNSIPIFFTELYDNMYGTNNMPIWDYGLEFSNTVLQDAYGLYSDQYFVQRPMGYTQQEGLPVQPFPGQTIDYRVGDGRPMVSGYGVSWDLLFLEYTQPEETIADYPTYLQAYGREISGDQMYVVNDYNNPNSFGAYEILSCLFTLGLAKQRGDISTQERILNFLYSPYNKDWSPDGREMHWNTMALEPFLQSSLAYGWIWATTPVTIKDLAEPRPTEFWDYPYISEADSNNIWVYQAEWDPVNNGFILNIQVDQAATLTFSNFDATPTAYTGGISVGDWTVSGDDYILSLNPGTYHLVIR